MTEYKEANTQFYDCLKLGDDRYELYQKQMKVIWAKIRIELDDICSLSMDDIQTIAEIAREQADEYYKGCVNLYSRFNVGDKR
jgi:hypothetical protein